MIFMIKSKDNDILNHLRENADYTLKHLSKLTGIPQSTVHDRIIGLKKRGLISRFTVLANTKKLGYDHHCLLFLSSYNITQQPLIDYFKSHPAVNSAMRTNEDDFVLEVLFTNSLESEGFKHELEKRKGLVIKQVIPIKENIKKEGLRFGRL